MIRSMTGYGRAEALVDGRNILVEIRSVNHRYFEFSCRVPRAYGFLESRLKTYLQGKLSRGKVDVKQLRNYILYKLGKQSPTKSILDMESLPVNGLGWGSKNNNNETDW